MFLLNFITNRPYTRQTLWLVLAIMSVAAHAQPASTSSGHAYPTKPIRIIVGQTAGGISDLIARMAAQRLTETFKQSALVENRAGAAGSIGTEMAVKSAPDDYTLLLHPSVPAKTLKELITLARTRPDHLIYGSGGNGSPPHLTAELFKSVTGARMTHVPFKGSAPGVIALVGGQVDLSFSTVAITLP